MSFNGHFYLFQIAKFLDSSGSKQNYRLYGEYLFDILFAGGILGKRKMNQCYQSIELCLNVVKYQLVLFI
jgi:hypothetical protein